jgi:glycosyltransferase involved in cell wall biosynthesis
LRICIIGKYPPIQGGVSMRTYWTAYRLAEHGHEVHVVTNAKEATPPFRMHMRPEDWARCEAQFSDGSLIVHWSDPVDRSQSYIPMASPFVSKLASIAAKLHAERPFDVIYSHYMEPYGVAGYLASKMTGVPHVVRMAGSDAGRLWHHPQLDTLYDHVLRSAESVVAGGAVKQRAIERGANPSRIDFGGGYTLPETLFTPDGPVINIKSLIGELGSEDPVGDTLWGDFTGERNYFGVYGKLGETKGSFALLAAMHQLKLAGANVGLVALAHGKPDVEGRFRQMAQELGLTDRILQIPFLPHWRVPEFLRGCLAVCCLEQDFPITIHSPMVAREALLCGCCLVASRELLRKLPDYDQLPNGYGCVAVDNVNDVGQLAKQLADIANDPAPTAAVGARGYNFARRLEHQTGFPHKLDEILTSAAARKRVTEVFSSSGSELGAPDDTFQLTRLCADALRKATAKMSPTKGRIDILKARAILAAIRKAVAKGVSNLEPLIPAVEIEITVATAERALEESCDVETNKAFVRLNIRRWAIDSDDLHQLLPIQNPHLSIVKFDFDVAPYLAARNVDDFPVVTARQPSYVVVFAHNEGRQSEPLLVDSATSCILRLSRGELTALQIASQLVSEHDTTPVEESLAWIEELFRRGLIGLRDGDQMRTEVQANRKSAPSRLLKNCLDCQA